MPKSNYNACKMAYTTKPPSEHEEQKALFDWARLAQGVFPELRMMAAVPNGGLRTKAVAGKLKAEGVKAGYPDIVLDVARGGYHGMRIEMKSATGRTSPEQKSWLADLVREGYHAVVCHGFEEAQAAIVKYLQLGKK